jgi:putative FmdB family regulatory protein
MLKWRMPRVDDYQCPCGETFETMKMTADEVVACPACGGTEVKELMGAPVPFHVIVPMHRTSLKNKAGHVHYRGDKPATKPYVAMPKTLGD